MSARVLALAGALALAAGLGPSLASAQEAAPAAATRIQNS